MASDALIELLELLQSSKIAVKTNAHVALAQLSGSDEGVALISGSRSVVDEIISFVASTPAQESTTTLLSSALTTLTNLTSCDAATSMVIQQHQKLVPSLVKLILEPSSCHADRACGLLVNLTRLSENCAQLLDDITASFPALMAAATNTKYNTNNNTLDLLPAVIENVSQLPQGRKLLIDHDQFMIQTLLPFLQYPHSTARRRAVVATLHNCCFDKEEHMWLLSKDIDLANNLCLPLAGPDSFTDEENEELSDMLSYLPDDKQREPSQQIRLLLLQALTQLCTTRPARELLRDQNIYYVLRELHKWETDQSCLLLLEDLINILIRKEEEINAEDLSALEVSEDMSKKFIKMDQEFLEESATSPEKPSQ